jgi:uncharacterized protein (TIGR00369 family)
MTLEPTSQAPAGFRPITVTLGGAFATANGPLWLRQQGTTTELGLRIDERHCSGLGVCHGGMLATFADILMPMVFFTDASHAPFTQALPTVSLQLDYISPVRRGDFIRGEAQVLKVTRRLVFAQGLVRVESQVVLRCSGVFARAGELSPDWPGFYVDAPTAPRP